MSSQKRISILLQHEDFTLYVSCDDITRPLDKLQHTYSQRGVALPSAKAVAVVADEARATHEDGSLLDSPFFFENRQYWFEFEFNAHVDQGSAAVNHKHRLIEGAFHLSRNGNALQAALNFGNDVGRCRFTVAYKVDAKLCSVDICFTIFATKMVMEQDLGLINQAIDGVYPLWRYSLSSKTSQQVSRSCRSTGKFELFWLAQFERLVEELQRGVKQIINSPHNRLQSFTKQQSLDRVNKRLSHKQAEAAQQRIKAGVSNPRICIHYKKLHIDTPENRFIKMVITSISNHLAVLIAAIAEPKNTKVSDSFIQSLQTWQNTFSKMAKQPFWQEVGSYKGLANESKVLQQGTGYAKVYKVWQQLKHYLNKTGGHSELSVKSVAELYEIWCFIEVISIIESLGFIEQKRELSKLKQVQFEKQFTKDGMAAAFEFYRNDGMVVKLAHEPTFSPNHQADNRTWLANQRPDIVLQVTLKNEESFFILFDAKYRIDNYQIKGKDAVPEDAINQMHRYRDAIIHQQKIEHENPIKSRPVMGAFALYPGFCDQEHDENPYQEAIDQVGIGAFALLPNTADDQNKNSWLRQYLVRKLGAFTGNTAYDMPKSHDYYFVEDATRISPYGSQSTRYHGLTMVAPLNEIARNPSYLQQAQNGQLTAYHTQLMATNRQNVHRNIMREVRYLVVTVRDAQADRNQLGKYLYRVTNVKLTPRDKIATDITGKESTSDSLYWLFELGDKPVLLHSPIEKPYVEHFEFKLTKAELLSQVKHWGDINAEKQLYADLDLTW